MRVTIDAKDYKPDRRGINRVIAPILALITVLASFGFFFYFVTTKLPAEQKDVALYVAGVISTLLTNVLGFYFGSSSGSKTKTEALARKSDV